MKLISYIKKLFIMGTSKHITPKFIAKRKFWIEWECIFDLPPSPKDLADADNHMRIYIANYLDDLFKKKHDSLGSKPVPAAIPSDIAPVIDDVLGVGTTPLTKAIGAITD